MNEELVNKILEGIAKDEGTEGRAVALEGGGSTRGYGITVLSEGFKKMLSFNNLNADEMPDKEVARQLIIYNIGEMKKDMGEETWNNLPDQMKIVASDQYYNSGKLFDGFKRDLISGNYENALKNTLDIISANDPKTGTNGVMTGLINRRVSKYNEAAETLGFNQITNFTTGNSVEEGKQTAVTYNYNNAEPFTVNTIAGMHSQSLKKTDTSLIDNQLKADALTMDSTIPEMMLNPNIENETKTEIVANEVDNALGADTFNAIGNTISDVAGNVTEYILPSTRPEEEKQNESINAKDFIDSVEEPQLWDIDYTRPYDKEDLLYLEQKQQTTSKDLENKYTWTEEQGAAYQQEWMGTNLWEQFNAENLKPDLDFVLNKENLDRYMEDLPEDFREEFAYAHSEAHAMQIRSQLLEHLEMEEKIYSDGQFSGTMKRLLAAFTDPAAYAAIIASEGLLAPVVILQKMGRVGRIIRRGVAGGASFGVIEGYLASQRPDLDVDDVMHGILTGAFLGGLFGIRKPRAKSDKFTKLYKDGMDEQNAKLNPPDPKNPNSSGGGSTPKIFNKGDRILINNKGDMGTVVGLNQVSRKLGNMNDTYIIKLDNKSKVSSTQNDNMVLSREIVDELNIKNTQNKSTPLITADNPNPLKQDGTRMLDWYDPNYDMALATKKRPDGRFEVMLNRTNNGEDEMIMQINKDGTVEVRKCL